MADVAALARVSHQTVSRVVNGDPRVRRETAERVASAIAELGYRRNNAARLLASSRSRTIGVVTWGTSQWGPTQVILGLENAARSTDHRLSTVAIAEMTPEAVRSAFDQLLGHAPEAIVVIVPHETVLHIAQDIDLGVPTVVVGGDLSRTPLTAGVDNVQGGRLATRHLVELGHTSIVHVAGPPGWREAGARAEGWRAELRDAGLDVPPLRWGGDWSPRSGYRAGVALARERDVTAVFVANDQMALGLCAALREHGRVVPDQLSIVGFDDLPESEFFAPPLTTVRQDFTELGRRAMELVERALAGEEMPSVELVPTRLVVRSSTAGPPS
jgi:DNA-binding LacI/PurR family transcriptional regulator